MLNVLHGTSSSFPVCLRILIFHIGENNVITEPYLRERESIVIQWRQENRKDFA